MKPTDRVKVNQDVFAYGGKLGTVCNIEEGQIWVVLDGTPQSRWCRANELTVFPVKL